MIFTLGVAICMKNFPVLYLSDRKERSYQLLNNLLDSDTLSRLAFIIKYNEGSCQ